MNANTSKIKLPVPVDAALTRVKEFRVGRVIPVEYQDGWLDDDFLPFPFFEWFESKFELGEERSKGTLIFTAVSENGRVFVVRAVHRRTRLGAQPVVTMDNGDNSCEISPGRCVYREKGQIVKSWTRTANADGVLSWKLTSKTVTINIHLAEDEIPVDARILFGMLKGAIQAICSQIQNRGMDTAYVDIYRTIQWIDRRLAFVEINQEFDWNQVSQYLVKNFAVAKAALQILSEIRDRSHVLFDNHPQQDGESDNAKKLHYALTVLEGFLTQLAVR